MPDAAAAMPGLIGGRAPVVIVAVTAPAAIARPVRMFTLHVQGTEARLVGDTPLGADDRPSIAVLPFRKNQTDSEEAYFADGIVDDIIYALAGLRLEDAKGADVLPDAALAPG